MFIVDKRMQTTQNWREETPAAYRQRNSGTHHQYPGSLRKNEQDKAAFIGPWPGPPRSPAWGQEIGWPDLALWNENMP